MDTSFLLSFIEVIEKGSIADVARDYSLTPAAVNQRIKKVEEELGFKLVVRSGRTVKPTAQGAHVLAQAKLVMEEVRKLKGATPGSMVFGHLSLGAFDSAMSTMIPVILPPLIARYPDLEIGLVKGYSVHLYSKVADNELDAALVVQPHFKMHKSMEWHFLRNEPLIVLAPSHLTEEDPHELLRSQPLICYDRKLWGGQLADNYLRQHGIHPKVRIELAAVEMIARLVSEGLGVSLVPEVAGDLMEGPKLRRVRLRDTSPVRSVGLLWNRHSVRATLVEEILEICQACIR